VPEEYFNLVSTRDYYLNSRFVYLATGKCNYNDTECFSHPGTYIDELGLGMAGARVKLMAGAHSSGLRVYVNDIALSAGTRITLPLDNSTHVHVVSATKAVLALEDMTITVTNSDFFFNMAAQLTNTQMLRTGSKKVVIPSTNPSDISKALSEAYPGFAMEGLLGGTYRNVEYSHRKLYRGEPTDYQVSDLFSSEFPYTQYQL